MFSLYRKYLGHYTPFVIATFITTCITYFVQLCLLLPESKRIIDKGVNLQNTDVIWQSGIMMVIFTLIIGICNFLFGVKQDNSFPLCTVAWFKNGWQAQTFNNHFGRSM